MLGGTLEQPYVFMAAMYCGMICGLFYSIMRLFRRGKISSVVTDVLFGLFSLAAMGVTLLKTTYLEIRPFFFGGVMSGMVIFLCGITPLISVLYKLMAHKCKFLHCNVDNIKK